LFKKAIEIDSSNPEYLAQFYVDNGKHLEAIPLLEKVNKNAPNNPKTLMLLGISFGAIKKYPDAINYLNQSIKIAPLNEQAKYYLSAAVKLNNDTLANANRKY
jgi:tetratricopeptide (TPR) repeat protein